ncbi:uncharacterized protein LOC117505704 [Thalassophryne amazonica]|uniref:uncharacterized protein LOC117505704 n=1 Tax=Thalassophryne amazonica TaxID=390379 RepID=UPI00147193F7|nr:uncharacterized protein LOC117505704 [Thalassophryne amazonica]
MADEDAAVETGSGSAPGPLVAVTFERNASRKEKFLESEPQALGITQIGLGVFQIVWKSLLVAQGLTSIWAHLPIIISSLLVIIAGSLAIAGQNLHLPTLKACLGMQIVACGTSFISIFVSLTVSEFLGIHCYSKYYENGTYTYMYLESCQTIEKVSEHINGETMLIKATLVAISAALAAYCCKVVNCCSPAPNMPVITVQAPPTAQ